MSTLARQSSSTLLPTHRLSEGYEEREDFLHPLPLKPLSHSSQLSSLDMHQHGPLHRRDTDAAVTDSTMFSVTSSSNINPSTEGPPSARDCSGGGRNGGGRSHKQGKKNKGGSGSGSRFNLGGRIRSILKRGSKKKPLSETQLRKKVRKAAEKGDWEAARKLVANYEFSVIPETMPKRGSFSPSIIPEEPPQQQDGKIARRPSYGSRSGERRSFTGKESAAAAAAIKAAALEESSSNCGMESAVDSSGEQRTVGGPDIGENILHDVCRFNGPLDLIETLLAALRHRRGCTTGTDDQDRTPLHLSAMCGAPSEVIDALIRADPAPASMGDVDRRSPLHLAMRNHVYPVLPVHGRGGGKHQVPQEQIPSPEQTLERTSKTVQILKETMITYPGRIDFKDEDKSGYSPLDYAIDGNVDILIQCLIRRREPRQRRSQRLSGLTTGRHSFGRGSCGRSVYSTASSVTEAQDMEILHQLEQDEIDARKYRIAKMKKKRQKQQINHALFDVFGIEEQPTSPSVAEPSHADPSSQKSLLKNPEEVQSLIKSRQGTIDKDPQALTDADVYNQHLEDYLNDYMDDFEGGLEYADEDGFDIFQDPEELDQDPDEEIIETESLPEVIVVDQDECMSVMSEVTVPLGSLGYGNQMI